MSTAAGRPLDPAVTAKILHVVVELVGTHGFRDLRIDDVAERAGTSKQAVYRRWSGKSELVAEALRAALGSNRPNDPRTGSLRRDLVAVLGQTIRALERTSLGAAVRALVSETADEALARALGDVEASRRTPLQRVLRAACERGELARDRDVDLDVDALLGAAYYRLLVRRVALEGDLATRLVDAWLASAMPGLRQGR